MRNIVRNHKAFEGFKTKPVEFVRNAMNEVAGGIRALQHQLNHGLVPAMSEVPNTPNNTQSTRALMNTADETLSRVVGKGTGKNVIKNVKFYSTRIDNQVEKIEKMPLPHSIAATFKDSNYRTVITKENITVYRTFGGHADAGGTFATTSHAVNRIHTKIDLALLPEWKNTRNYEAVIEVPKGTILNIGRAEKQITKTGSILKVDADQILLPLNYPLEWIKEIRRISSK